MSPLGATATWRAGAVTSAMTFAQKPAGNVSPPLSGSHTLVRACWAVTNAAEHAMKRAQSSLSMARMINPKSQTPNLCAALRRAGEEEDRSLTSTGLVRAVLDVAHIDASWL